MRVIKPQLDKENLADPLRHFQTLRHVTLGVNLGHVGFRMAENDLSRFQPKLAPHFGRRRVPELIRCPAVRLLSRLQFEFLLFGQHRRADAV